MRPAGRGLDSTGLTLLIISIDLTLFLSFYLSPYLSPYLSLSLCFFLSLSPFSYTCLSLFVFVSLRPSVSPSVLLYLSFSLCPPLTVPQSLCPSVSVSLFVCLSGCVCMCRVCLFLYLAIVYNNGEQADQRTSDMSVVDRRPTPCHHIDPTSESFSGCLIYEPLRRLH